MVRDVQTPAPAEDSAETKARRDKWVPRLGERWLAALDAELRRVHNNNMIIIPRIMIKENDNTIIIIAIIIIRKHAVE